MNELARWGDSVFDIVPTFFRPLSRSSAWFGPRMDLAESETAYELAVELPGIPKDAIQVGVFENSVTITAETPADAETKDDVTWLLRERSAGKISREIALPEAVDETSSSARYADGVLYLTLQKKRASQIKRLTLH